MRKIVTEEKSFCDICGSFSDGVLSFPGKDGEVKKDLCSKCYSPILKKIDKANSLEDFEEPKPAKQNKKNKIDDKTGKEILELYKCGVSQKSIADDFGLSQATVSRYISDHREPEIPGLRECAMELAEMDGAK